LGAIYTNNLTNILAVPQELEEPVRRQQHWAIGLVSFAIFTCGIALISIHRTLLRQRQLNEMKSQFVASASHELRAPVASIRLMTDALESQEIAPETVKEFHRLIARESARLSTLVGNVLDLSCIEQHRKIWNMESCDLSALAADAILLMEPLAREKTITLTSELSPVDATVDAAAIQQALINLLDNAIKFSPSKTTIAIELAN
jgi:signal transduction histidine kinase